MRQNRAFGLAHGLAVLIVLLALLVLLTLPLAWQEQAIFGATLIAVAVLLNRLSRSAVVTLTLMTISVFSTLRYGYWRVVQSWDGLTSAGHLHQWNAVFVILLLLAEFYAFATLILGYFQTLRPLTRQPVPLAGDRARWPTVDVFIPTYNEPLTVVRATVLGVLAIDYPTDRMRVFVLDDGRRSEFRDFAARVGAGYVTRDTNAHAKAGNINHALERTTGEFVAIFDSDHIPVRSFLQMTLGWFRCDARLGLVQTPHHFYSPDPFERNLGQFRKIPNEGELFHRLVQDGNDLWNASFFCGSCAVLRRAALDQIGGIAVETVTEDAHTALRLQRKGWNTAYINVPLAAGLATESLAAHIGQRIRWARGMVQVLRIENPLFARGLTCSQRLCYFNATTHFLFAVPRLIFLTVPLVYLLLGMVNIYGYSLAVFAYAFPHIVLSNVTNSRIQGRYRFSFWNEIYEAVLAPYILVPTMLALINPRLGRFNVTSKGGIVPRSYFDRAVALPFIFLLFLNVAGLVMAERRYVTDPAHHDTVIMNTAWTFYNIIILSVAASVARERRQRRSEVRVPMRVPVTLVTEANRQVRGLTTEVSRRGAAAHFESSFRLEKGAPVVVVFNGGGSHCEIPARVAHSAGRRQHLRFWALDLSQERFLLSLVYLRPEAWVAWHGRRSVDRPLRSLLQIVWLSLRGLAIVLGGLFTPPTFGRRRGSEATPERERAPGVAATVVFAFLVLSPSPLRGSPVEMTTADSSPSPSRSPTFHEVFDLERIGARHVIALEGRDASESLFFDVPVTKIVSEATLHLHYSAPLVAPDESRLELWLNGTRVGSVTLVPGADRNADIALPTDLLTTDNALVFRVNGSCSACARPRAPWITIDPRSTLGFRGSKLQLANDLSLLPIPFFDAARQRRWTLPVVFSDRPDTVALEAASAVASWFGVFSDIRGVRFPVTLGALPEGNAVVFARRGSELWATLSLPPRPGALIAVRDNPRDPYGKLLIVAGDRSEDLLAGARALATSRGFPKADAASVRDANTPARGEYDAPRWLQSDRPAAVGMYTTEEQLKVRGSGSINIYFRLAPDLFLPARQSVPLLLKYGYAGVAQGARAALHVRLNGQDVDGIPLKTASSSVEEAEVIQLPTGRLRPYANTLTVDFDFGRQAPPTNVWQYAAVHRDSSIDLRGLPHAVVLPRLELFVDSGYPFTRWPDLSRTAVVLPDAPTPIDYEALLNMAGFFGAQTGYPTIALAITDAAHVQAVRDRDLVVLGAPASQPLLSAWAGAMPLELSREGMKIGPSPQASRWLHPQWPFRPWDLDRLARLVDTGAQLDVIVEDFVSPFHPTRSVVAMVPLDSRSADAVATLFLPDGRAGPVYGGLAIARGGRFESFLVGTRAYHSGSLGAVQRAKVFLFEYYWLIALLVLVMALVIATELRRAAERVAARRLAVNFTRGYSI